MSSVEHVGSGARCARVLNVPPVPDLKPTQVCLNATRTCVCQWRTDSSSLLQAYAELVREVAERQPGCWIHMDQRVGAVTRTSLQKIGAALAWQKYVEQGARDLKQASETRNGDGSRMTVQNILVVDASLKGRTGGVSSVALSAAGRLLANGSFDGTVLLWDTDNARKLATLEGHTATVRAVALSADGRLLASGGEDRTLRLWDTATRGQLAILEGHTTTLRGVAISADGHLVASGSFDGTVRLWEVSSGACLRVLRTGLRYEGLDIAGLTGVTEAQRSALFALGAVEEVAWRTSHGQAFGPRKGARRSRPGKVRACAAMVDETRCPGSG